MSANTHSMMIAFLIPSASHGPTQWDHDEDFYDLPITLGPPPRPTVQGPVSYEALLEPFEGQWLAWEVLNYRAVIEPTPEAAKEALAKLLGELMAERHERGLGMPEPQPLRIEGNEIVGILVGDGWSLFTVTPKPPDQGSPTPAVEEAPEAAPCRTVTLGPLLSRMTGFRRTTEGLE